MREQNSKKLINYFRFQKGFTMFELIVVISITFLLLAMVIFNYRTGGEQLKFQRSANKVAQDIRRTSEMAMSSRRLNSGNVPEGGYGIYFDTSEPSRYILFADGNNDKQYSSGEEIETVQLETNITITNLSPSSPLTIVFTPPNPTVTINKDFNNTTASITIGGLSQTTYTYTDSGSTLGWRTPKARCDTNPLTKECPSTFSATASDPPTVYDQYKFGRFQRSQKYQKKETTSGLSKIIEVNNAGLVNVR